MMRSGEPDPDSNFTSGVAQESARPSGFEPLTYGSGGRSRRFSGEGDSGRVVTDAA